MQNCIKKPLFNAAREEKIVRIPESGCWIWMGALNNSGYGCLGGGNSVHRASFEYFIGQIPPKTDVCHRCDIRCCVNPSHLFLGSRKENMKDAVRKGRIPRGEKRAWSKLVPEKIVAIRQKYLSGSTQEAIAIEFKISRGSVGKVIRREKWKHV